MAKKILIIEDEILILKSVEAYLIKKGFEVIIAINGLVGLEKAKAELPDLILLDVEMPQMNGYMFLGKLKEIPEIKSIPIIVLPESSDMEPIFRRKGVKEFLMKPLNFDLMHERVQQVLKG